MPNKRQKIYYRDGTSQSQRLTEALQAGYAKIEDRSVKEYY